eukprot:NODE_92_length_21543_cov_0.719036.p6 type:complete len:235 gc:universal NODE_92_length_21543_cov_0.719036:9916-9212(-)
MNIGTEIGQLLFQLYNPETRQAALFELSKKRETIPEMALYVWNATGICTLLVQEMTSIYPYLSPPKLTSVQSNRVCNALALLQCLASHVDTKQAVIHCHIPLYLYPFLNTTSKLKPFEYLRLTSLGVIGALVKQDSTEVIAFLLSTEIIPLCLRIMESGTELSRVVAIFIVQKILTDEIGLNYICQTYERFNAVNVVLSHMVNQLMEQPSQRVLKHIIRCYVRLMDHPRYSFFT